jgi:DNA-binding NarL/FixJ family response regulator
MAVFRVLIIDDHPVVLSGLRLLLDGDPAFAICGEAASPSQACLITDDEQPDIIITDLAMAGEDGSHLVDDLLAILPTTRILVYSSHEESTWAPRVIRSGARGFISKAEPLDTVATALEAIIGGDIYVSPAAQRLLVNDFARSAVSETKGLSTRELQVLRLIAEGASLQSLAQRLELSVKTVGTYRERLKTKLGLDSVRMLERFAVDYVAGRATLS